MSLSWVEATRLSAKGGPADRLRRWLIAGCAALAAMIVAAAASLPSQVDTWSPDRSVLGELLAQPDLMVGVAAALLVMAVPVIHLTAQVVRVGGPARDRRLVAVRAAGGTRADVRRVVQSEAVVWSALGAASGILGFCVLMSLGPRFLRVEYADFGPDIGAYGADMVTGTRPVISLVWPHPLVLVLAGALVPVLAAAVLPLATRRLTAAPRTPGQSRESPTLAVLAVVSAGVAVLSVAALLSEVASGPVAGDVALVVAALSTVSLAACLLTSGASWVARTVGRRLTRSGSGTSLIAGRLMHAHPHLSARTAGSLVPVGLVGGFAVPYGGFLESSVLDNARENGWDAVAADGRMTSEVLFYTVPVAVVQMLVVVAAVLGAIGLLIAVAEQVATRGPDLARYVAAGLPRRVLRRALVLEAAAPAVVLTSLSLLGGAAAAFFPFVLVGHSAGQVSVEWGRLIGLWLVLVGGAVLASWLGGLALPSAAEPQHIRDRE